MKKIFLALSIIFMYAGCAQNAKQKKQNTIPDGFYSVVRSGTDSTNFSLLNNSQLLISVDSEFMKNDPQDFTKAVIDVSDYVPLELEKLPVTQQQTDLKKSLLITLTPEASKKVRSFTEARVMQHVAIVMDGKILTMHKIREAITGGEIQITRCDDNACEYLLVKMKDKVKK